MKVKEKFIIDVKIAGLKGELYRGSRIVRSLGRRVR
jgi:hypothetical protein